MMLDRTAIALALVVFGGCFGEPPSSPSSDEDDGDDSWSTGSESTTSGASTSTSSSSPTSDTSDSSNDASSGEVSSSGSTGDPDEPRLILWHAWDGDYVDTISGEEGIPIGDASVNTSALELHGAGSVDISHFTPTYAEVLESMTVSFRYFANTGDGLRVLLALGDNGESLSTNAHQLRIHNNVFVLLTETGDGEDHFAELGATPSFAVGAWHTVTFVFDDGVVRTCSDGTWLSEVEYVPAQTVAEKLFVGGTWLLEGWDGLLDDLRIWDGAMPLACP